MVLAETPSHRVRTPDTLVALLRRRAVEQPGRVAYTFLSDGSDGETQLSYDELDQQARSIAAYLQSFNAAGQRVLLLYPPGLDYIAAFFGCLYAGAIAVPAYPPRRNRSLERLRAIVADAQAAFALTTETIYSRVRPLLTETPDLLAVRWVTTDVLSGEIAGDWREPLVNDRSLAFLQYTSGSTSTPKGVMVTHRNLLANQEMIRRAFRQSSESVIAGWLPMYHDMGLIGNVLQPMYLGTSCVLLSPASFLQQPARWLQAITKYRVTTSGGPNFAYDLCVNKIDDEQRAALDLSSWTVAFNGAEPVRAETMQRFADAFSPCGFDKTAFHPCYGLAEATLIVTGGRQSQLPLVVNVDAKSLEQGRVVEDVSGRALVSCGEVTDEQVIVIVNPATQRLCSAGEVGEVWLFGQGVAAGYWNRPDETEQTFDAELADSGAGPFLRTGDLGFINRGELFITGRSKDLIVIRGRNHYPQDLELTMERSHKSLRPGCGAAFSIDGTGQERLVLVQEVDARRSSTEGVIDAIKQAIFEEHEVAPYAIVLLKAGSVPKTSSGKIQRHACRVEFQAARWEILDEWRDPGTADWEAGSIPVPCSVVEIESWLVSQLAAKLGRQSAEIDCHRPVTSYGLDSLVALDWIHTIERQLGVEVSLAAILDSPSIAELAQHLSRRFEKSAVRIESTNSIGDAPLSHGQEALWFLHQLAPESAAYNLAFAARVGGDVDTSKSFSPALEDLIERHPSLRTTFHSVNGRPVQRVHERGELAFQEVDATSWSEESLDDRLSEEAHRPFDLEHGPLLRVHLFRRGADESILLLTAHHIVVDFWSLGILVDELAALYEARRTQISANLPALPIQYTDYQQWQADFLKGREGEYVLEFWRERLSGELPVLDLATDKPRPSQQTFSGASLRFKLSEKLTSQLKALAESHNATLYTTLLAAFEALLYRHTGQQDILIGSPTTGRGRSDLAGVIGYFVNPIVLRGRPASDQSFVEFLDNVKRDVLSAFEHQDYPFPLLVEKLQPERDPSRSELFQAMFILHRSHLPEHQALAGFALGEAGTRMKWGSLTLESIALKQRVAQFDLTLMMAELDCALTGSLQYNTDLFEAGSMQRLQDHFVTLLEGIVAEPDRQLSRLPLLSAAEEQQLIDGWNQTQLDYPAHKTIHALFEEQVNRTPEAIALTRHHEHITFRELNARANQVAHRLQTLGVGPEIPVGICLERSIQLVVALLGVMKAGGAYVPLDPAYPKPRVAFMLEDARARVVITQSSLVDTLPESEAQLLCLDTEIDTFSRKNARSSVTAENLAYVIYTSGSTGKPKGVAITHRSAVALIAWSSEVFSADELRVVLASTSICFDLSVFELFVTLCLGGRVVIAEDALELPNLPDADEITLVNTVPSAITELFRGSGVPSSVRVVNLAGEPLLDHMVQKIYRQDTVEKVFNLYGPSEDTTYSTFALMQKGRGINSLIGRPISNTQVYLLDEHLQPVPIGVAGELYLGGDGLAREYLHRPDLTAAKFIPDPFSTKPGARLYRTEDRARYLHDGNIEFLGRIDNQVKIRGFRIELGEVETALVRHEHVREAVVTAQDVGGDKRLVAYIVTEKDTQPTAADFRAFLAKDLPHFMTPSVFVMLDALPLTPNGKVDRRALPVPGSSDLEGGAAYVAPRTPVEEVLATIWSTVLRVERVGVDDNFFDLGGHSLLATQIVSHVRHAFQIELPLRSLFEGPTIAQLSQHVEQALQSGQRSAPAIKRREREDNPPLSFAQQRLWFLDQLEPNSPAYNLPAAIRLEGPLDLDALERSLQETVNRHESLRTTFRVVDGEPVQVIAPHLEFKLDEVDLSEFEDREERVKQLAVEEARRPFDLSNGPLLRVAVLRLSETEHVLLFTMHHIVSDGWSLTVLTKELAALYDAHRRGDASPLASLPVQYADFALWQREWLKESVLDEQLGYWREQLKTIPPVLELPTDWPRPAVRTLNAAREPFAIPDGLINALRTLSRGEGVTLFMTLLAGFQILLARYSGQSDISVGTAIANRNRAETENLIGFFVNTLVMRADLSGNPTVQELLAQVREVALGAYAHQDVPFEKLVEELQPERSLNHTPFFQAVFSLQTTAVGTVELEGLNVTLLESETGVSKFDLVFNLQETSNSIEGSLEYSTDLFAPDTIAQMLTHYRNVLVEMAAHPETHAENIALMSEDERYRLLVEWNETATPFPHDATIQQLFEQQAANHPNAIALRFANSQSTYAELNARANQLAHHLSRLGIRPESVVGLLIDRSPEMVAAVLGILKAGGAYLPLDPSSPPERLAYMLNEANATVLLTQQDLLPRLPETEAHVICLNQDWSNFKDEPTDNPGTTTRADNLAYVMYTSGSTGVPKGVSVTHRSIIRLVTNTNYARFEPDEIFLQYAPLSFDASTFELWGSLLNGAQLVLMPAGVASLEELGEVLRREQVTTLWLTAGLFQQMVEQRLPDLKGVRQILAGGDVLSVEHVKQLLAELPPGARLINGYGPTENTTFTCCHKMNAGDTIEGSISIGRPIANTQVYVVDSHLKPTPRGVAGELLIGGEGLARGYWQSPELTAERFIPNPFSDEPGARLYRSGDRVRYRRNGELEFLGRLDQQVKLRGFRIEPGEIENKLNSHEAVRSAVVVVHSNPSRDRELAAYIVPEPGQTITVEELRNHLQTSLPPYMIPGAFVMLDELPLTTNGKVNRAALPAPDGNHAESTREYIAPRNETETQLANLWTLVLGREHISVEDNFFEIGGHSLLATSLVSRMRQTFSIELPLRQFFETPTIAQLAILIDERRERPQHVQTIQPRRRGARDFNQLLKQIENLSDDEARKLLRDTTQNLETATR